jgi:hypothetical protein
MANRGKKAGTPAVLSPEKLDADAASVKARGQKTLAMIRKRRAEMDAEGLHDEPLVVILGEAHSVPGHIAHEMEVIEGLAAEGVPVSVALEEDHSLLRRTFDQARWQRKTTPEEETLLQARDRDGTLSLAADLAVSERIDADHAQTTMRHYLKKRGIPVCYADEDVQRKNAMRGRDPEVAAAWAVRDEGPAPDKIDARGTKGVHVRNVLMARRALKFAKEHKSRVVVIICGAVHAAGYEVDFGGKVESFPARESLAAAVKNEGAKVLALPMITQEVLEAQDIPADHKLKPGDIRILTDLPQVEAVYDRAAPGMPVRGRPADLLTPHDDAAYFNGLLKRNGKGAYALSPAQRDKLTAKHSPELHRAFEKIDAATRPERRVLNAPARRTTSAPRRIRAHSVKKETP